MAPKKGRLDPLKKAMAALGARIPFLPKRPPASAEPFEAIEDDTPLGDLLSSSNAAPGLAPRATSRQKTDLRELLEPALRSPPFLIGGSLVLVFLLTLVVTTIVVNSPPKPALATEPFTEKGEALVKSWLPPPGDPFEARMAMEREGPPSYSSEDAARLGLGSDPAMELRLRDKNDEAIEDLYGTVP